tara:strand:+ start:28081 stop:28827 length:747 start_codon:yes stop_codon:yes gene_type:complete
MNDKNEFEDMVATISAEDIESGNDSDQEVVYTEIDPEWSEYVLDQLHDSELKQGNPTVDGLRRVTEALYGEIISSSSEVLELPSAKGSCSIKHTIVIKKYSSDSTVSVDGCVDVRYDKIPYPFNDHLVATADTRAEGKALRRALKLRIVTAEEMTNASEDDVMASEENITDQQILAINQMCKRLDINLVNLIGNAHANIESIREVNNLQGRLLLTTLSDYQRNMSSISEDLTGYDNNWRETFDVKGKK